MSVVGLPPCLRGGRFLGSREERGRGLSPSELCGPSPRWCRPLPLWRVRCCPRPGRFCSTLLRPRPSCPRPSPLRPSLALSCQRSYLIYGFGQGGSAGYLFYIKGPFCTLRAQTRLPSRGGVRVPPRACMQCCAEVVLPPPLDMKARIPATALVPIALSPSKSGGKVWPWYPGHLGHPCPCPGLSCSPLWAHDTRT